MPINLGGYNPHMPLGAMGQNMGKAYSNYVKLRVCMFDVFFWKSFGGPKSIIPAPARTVYQYTYNISTRGFWFRNNTAKKAK